jgi:hypothetical protein
MLLCCLRRTLKPSASAIAISKLYQHFRDRGLPYGLQDALPTLNPSCSLPINYGKLRHGSKARYGWVANPYKSPLLNFLPTGTFTLQDVPSLPRRDNELISGPALWVRFRVKAPVARRPPHRPGREDFPHPVPRFRFFYQTINHSGDTPNGARLCCPFGIRYLCGNGHAVSFLSFYPRSIFHL